MAIAPTNFLNSDPVSDHGLIYKSLTKTQRVAQAGSALEVARVLAEELLGIVDGIETKTRIECAAAMRIRQAKGVVCLKHIAADLAVSERHLRRRFQVTLGCSPKTYARRARLTAAVGMADVAAVPDWARIALDAGFYDQPHMIAEFKALIGLTPGAAHAERVAQPLVGDGSAFSNTRDAA